MSFAYLTDWLDDFAGEQYVWYVKRLSGNDTLATKSHQAGPYIPKDFAFTIFPELNQSEQANPRIEFDLRIDSHSDSRRATIIWYNNKFRDGTRNETRITNLGGSSSALLDPENTGALSIFVFELDKPGSEQECHVWVCEHETEEYLIESRIGIVEPGRKGTIWTLSESNYTGLLPPIKKPRVSCWLEANEIPPQWLVNFPSGSEIIKKTLELSPEDGVNPDKRLLKRRKCEFEIFRSIEETVELNLIKKGFESVDEFITQAQSILQRRKSRSGRSLELHIREIFIEEGLIEGVHFSYQPESDPGQKPDFLFPSQAAYKDPAFSDSKLRMLAVKTTCKDRWRQILNEASRIPQKHLLTLQEGVSEKQFKEMVAAQVQLVVPAPLIGTYPGSVRPHLMPLESFIAEVRLLFL